MIPRPEDPGSLSILVWEDIDFGGVLYRTERCLVLKRYAKPADADAYVLAYLQRFPELRPPHWRLRVSTEPAEEPGHSRVVRGFECYKARPTDDDVITFLRKRNWDGLLKPGETVIGLGRRAPREDDTGPKLVKYTPKLRDGGVCRAAWRDALGREPPAKAFPELTPVKARGNKSSP
jgi:hypothetical protein